jgi:hypothetical protein
MRRLRRVLGVLVVLCGALGAAYAWRRRPQIAPPEPAPDLTGAPPPLPERPPRLAKVSGNAHVLGPPWEPAALAALARWVPPVPATPAARALGYAWALPVTLVGLAAGAMSGTRPSLTDGVLLFAGARGPAAALLRVQGYAAITLGHVVLSTRDPDPTLMAHELVHVRQFERLGAFFAPLYGLLYLAYGYGRHPLERAARLGGRRAIGARG